MKYSFLLFACLSGLLQVKAQQKGFKVEARIDNPKGYPLALMWFSSGQLYMDTTAVMNGNVYVFEGTVDEPVLANLVVRNAPELAINTSEGAIPAPSLSFFLSNELVKISGAAEKIHMSSVQGGKQNDEWAALHAEEQRMEDNIWQLTRKVYAGAGVDSAALTRLLTEKAEQDSRLTGLRLRFIEEHPNAIASAYFLSQMVNLLEIKELKAGYDKLGPETRETHFGQLVKKKIDTESISAPGHYAVGFRKKDQHGDLIELSAFRGRYLLLDFWGSWCGPCRKGNPHLKDLYAKYHDKGLEIIGIAQEQEISPGDSRAAWIEAIRTDGLPWLQILNNEDIHEQNIVSEYGITAFPTKLLLDKEGKIVLRLIGTGPDDVQLDKMLEQVLGN